MCQRKLRSSHFHAAKAPFISQQTRLCAAPNTFLPLVVCQRKLRSSHFHATKGPFRSPQTLLCAAPNAFLPLVFCQRKLRSSHFHAVIGPFSPPRPFFLFSVCPLAAAHVPAEAPQPAHLCWQRRVWQELKGSLPSQNENFGTSSGTCKSALVVEQHNFHFCQTGLHRPKVF